MKQIYKIIGILSAGIIVLCSFTACGNSTSVSSSSSSDPSPEVAVSTSASFAVTSKGAESMTPESKDGKVIITQWTDYQCPFCALYFPDLQLLAKKYNGTNVEVVVRNFPLRDKHKNAGISAQAAEAANQQGKYPEYAQLLYKNNETWGTKSSVSALDDFKSYAKELGLDLTKFEKDYNSKATQEKIKNDEKLAEKAGVNSTPTLMVDNEIIESNPNGPEYSSDSERYKALTQVIEEKVEQRRK